MQNRTIFAFILALTSLMTVPLTTAQAKPTLPADPAQIARIEVASDNSGNLDGAYLLVHKEGTIEYFSMHAATEIRTKITPGPVISFDDTYKAISPFLMDQSDITAANGYIQALKTIGFKMDRMDTSYRAVCIGTVAQNGTCTNYFLPIARNDLYTKLHDLYSKSGPVYVPCKYLNCPDQDEGGGF